MGDENQFLGLFEGWSWGENHFSCKIMDTLYCISNLDNRPAKCFNLVKAGFNNFWEVGGVSVTSAPHLEAVRSIIKLQPHRCENYLRLVEAG